MSTKKYTRIVNKAFRVEVAILEPAQGMFIAYGREAKQSEQPAVRVAIGVKAPEILDIVVSPIVALPEP